MLSNMDTVERLKETIATGGRGLLTRIARESGVPYKTLEKIYRGDTKNPRYNSVKLLEAYFATARHRRSPPEDH
jgi:hypothetical protein